MTSSYIHSLTQQTLLEHFLWAVVSGRTEGVMKQAPQIPWTGSRLWGEQSGGVTQRPSRGMGPISHIWRDRRASSRTLLLDLTWTQCPVLSM